MLPLHSALEARSLRGDRDCIYSPSQALRFQGFVPRVKYFDPLNCSPVTDLISTQSLVICINAIGVCTVYSKDDDKQVGVLNQQGEQVRSMFLNQSTKSLVLVNLKASEGFSQLRCRDYALKAIEAKDFTSRELFVGEELKIPGFVEFDDSNKKIMTRCARTRVFKLWSMFDYSHLFTINDPIIQEVRLTNSLLMLIFPPFESFLPMKLISADDGHFLDAYELPMKPGQGIELVELFGSHLVFKQVSSPLLIYNLLERTYTLVPNFASPCGFIYLHLNSAFVAVRLSHFEVWNFRGKQLAKLDTAPSVKLGFNMASKIFVTSRQDYIIVCSRTGLLSTIQVIKLTGGEVIAEVSGHSELHNVSSIYFDEEDLELLTGDIYGRVTRWLN